MEKIKVLITQHRRKFSLIGVTDAEKRYASSVRHIFPSDRCHFPAAKGKRETKFNLAARSAKRCCTRNKFGSKNGVRSITLEKQKGSSTLFLECNSWSTFKKYKFTHLKSVTEN